jgi:LPXTG-motif cell wall-anchored protein
MASRRSLTTTTAAAGALLAAVFFVPSASASVEHSATPAAHHSVVRHVPPLAHVATSDLADTGSVDTTPYTVGGTAFLTMGGALLVIARRRALTLG